MRSGCHWMIVKQDEGNIMRKKDELLTRYDYRVDEDCVLRSNFRWGWPSVRVFPMDSTTGPWQSTRPAPVVPMLSILRPFDAPIYSRIPRDIYGTPSLDMASEARTGGYNHFHSDHREQRWILFPVRCIMTVLSLAVDEALIVGQQFLVRSCFRSYTGLGMERTRRALAVCPYHIVTLVRDHFSTEPSRHSICFNAGTKRKNIGAFRSNVPRYPGE